MAVHNRTRPTRLGQTQRLRARADHQIAADQHVCFTGGHTDRADILGRIGQTAVDMHRTTFLRQPGHLHHAGRLAIQMRRLRQHGTDGHNARAANARDHHIMGAVDLGQCGHGQGADIHLLCGRLFQLCPLDRHKRRAKAVQTREILVAGRLVNRALAPQFGFQRHDRHAVGLHTAIAAAFANLGIDEDAFVRVRKSAALAAATLFRRAGLYINKNRYALDFAKSFLNRIQLGAREFLHIWRQDKARNILFVIIDHHRLGRSHGGDFGDDLAGA